MPAVVAALLPAPAPASPATSGSHQHSSLCGASAAAVAPLLAASRASSPEPDWRDEEAVRLAGLALQLSQVGGGLRRMQEAGWWEPGGPRREGAGNRQACASCSVCG